ncbi:tyrosine-type recombinase/integrase [Rhodobacter sp. CZR27]|uniref:tyrosine-type recombinase/integrase n=1 Tax=Rhodobacter sp. CZR27 TaxID=2033869 RepID=UPI0012FE7BD5|nr:tyrosine-type recombinase/integrase [Rhodobacter sp. CZR27]
MTLKDVRDRWIEDRRSQGKAERSISIFQRNFAAFIDYLGGDEDRDAKTITPDDIEGWIAHLLAKGLSRKSIGDSHIALVKAGFMLSRRKLPQWPFENVRFTVPEKRTERSKGFTSDEASAILKAARDGLGRGPRTPETLRRAYRWVPWICAYTGARVGEIIQLRKQDFREENGIKFIRITPEAGTTKTGMFRDVPLHEQLLAEGLWEFVADLPPGTVFMPKPKTEGAFIDTTAVAGRLREWIRTTVGIKDGRVQPNHAWRHRFITVARGKMSDETRNKITGHADGNVSAGYGETELPVLVEAIAQMPRIAFT